jgi:hypothetical protein
MNPPAVGFASTSGLHILIQPRKVSKRRMMLSIYGETKEGLVFSENLWLCFISLNKFLIPPLVAYLPDEASRIYSE